MAEEKENSDLLMVNTIIELSYHFEFGDDIRKVILQYLIKRWYEEA